MAIDGTATGGPTTSSDAAAEATARPVRIDVDLAGTLTASDGHAFAVTIRDLSATGFRLDLGDEEVLVGEEVVLQVGRHDNHRAEIRWAAGREAGGNFLAQVASVGLS